MDQRIQVRRGTAAQLASITPAQGEPCWTTDTKQLFMGDGTTLGAIPVNPVVNIKALGARGDGSDCHSEIQAVIDLVKAVGGSLFIPRGSYLSSLPLDFTNSINGIIVYGEGNSSQIHFTTGTVCLDCTGSSDISFRDFRVISDHASKVGLLGAPSSTYSYAQRIRLYHVTMEGNYTQANVYNYGAEEMVLDGCTLSTTAASASSYQDTNDNAGTGEGMTSPCTTIGTGAYSNSCKRIFGGTTLGTYGAGSDCVRLRGTLESSFDGVLFISAVTATPNRSVVYINQDGAYTTNLTIRNFRHEHSGRKATDGILVNGSNSTGDWSFRDGSLDVLGSMLNMAAGNLEFCEWKDIKSLGSSAITVNQMDYCDISTPGAIVAGSTVANSYLVCDSTSTFATLATTNVVIFADTGKLAAGSLAVMGGSGNAVINLMTGAVVIKGAIVAENRGSWYRQNLHICLNGDANANNYVLGTDDALYLDGVNKTMKLPAYGAGTATFDGSGNMTSVSDAAFKTIDAPFERGLAEVLQLVPKVFHWNELSGLNQGDVNAGLVAQDVSKTIPEAVGRNQQGFLTLADRPIIAALINAIKELNAKIEAKHN